MAAIPPLSFQKATNTNPAQSSGGSTTPASPPLIGDRKLTTQQYEKPDPLQQLSTNSDFVGGMAMVTTMAPRLSLPNIALPTLSEAVGAVATGGVAAAPFVVAGGAVAAGAAGLGMAGDLANTMSRQQFANAAAAPPPTNWTDRGLTQDQWRQHVEFAAQDGTNPYEPRTYPKCQATDILAAPDAARSAGHAKRIDTGSSAPLSTPIDQSTASPFTTPIDQSTTSPFVSPLGEPQGVAHTGRTTLNEHNGIQGYGFPIAQESAADHATMVMGSQDALKALPGWSVEQRNVTRTDPTQARKDFEKSGGPREQFVRHLAQTQQPELKAAGLTDDNIAEMARTGESPKGFNVHHIQALSLGGTNDPSNLDLVRTKPDHDVLSHQQATARAGMTIGETRTVDILVPPAGTQVYSAAQYVGAPK